MFKITAAVTTCRREWKTVERAIISIENQTHKPCEILLVSDNSSDTKYLAQIVMGLRAHPTVRLLSDGTNHGVSYARNWAIKEAKGDYIAFLDDDDEWLPDKLQNQVRVIEEHPNAALIFGRGMKYWNGKEEMTWSSTIYKEHPSYLDMLKNDHVGSASHPLISILAARFTGGFKEMPAVEDYEFWIRIAKTYPIYGCKKILYKKHMPDGKHVSGNFEKTFLGYVEIYKANKKDYNKNVIAKERIFYNIIRRGIPAMTWKVIPYLLQWPFLKFVAFMKDLPTVEDDES